MRTRISFSAAVLQRHWTLAFPVALAVSILACSSTDGTTPLTASGGTSNSAGGSAPAAGGNGVSGGNATAGSVNGAAGDTPVGGGGAPGSAGALAAGAGAPATNGGAPAVGGGSSSGADTPPVRPLKIDKALAKNKQFTFTAKQLDPMAGTSKEDTFADAQEYGSVNTQKTVVGKLVMTLGGIGNCCGQGGIGGFAAGLGFHHLAIAMQTKISSAPDEYKKIAEAMRTDEVNRQMGDGRMEAWDGKDRVSWLTINEHDSFAYRAALGLKYMQVQDPGGDWEYFLNADGTVRWSDVYLVGYSYGSQTLAVVAKYVRIGRGIATSGPEDEDFPNALWIKAPSATPLDRMYGLFGSTNVGNKVETTQHAGWLGEPLTVASGAAAGTFGTSHLLILTGQGHSEFCAGDGGPWKALCQYAFGVMQ